MSPAGSNPSKCPSQGNPGLSIPDKHSKLRVTWPIKGFLSFEPAMSSLITLSSLYPHSLMGTNLYLEKRPGFFPLNLCHIKYFKAFTVAGAHNTRWWEKSLTSQTTEEIKKLFELLAGFMKKITICHFHLLVFYFVILLLEFWCCAPDTTVQRISFTVLQESD